MWKISLNCKQDLNEALSKTVKLLQTKAKIEGDSVIQSDSEPLQQFILVLEAAFVHGLKINYYEKQKNENDLPKPQFWNLICRLSHKDAIEEVRKLNYVKTNVGRCRAWLRLALNELALSSYLTALLQSSEYAGLLLHYYESHALFQDNELRDIFLSYLQGTENLSFELVCNSAILDTWTRTPLELSGIIDSNSARKKFVANLNATNHLSVFNESLKQARSFDSIHSLGKKDENVTSLLKDTFQSSYESSTSQTSLSPSDLPPYPAIQVDGAESSKTQSTKQSEQERNSATDVASVLYERYLNPRRRVKYKHEDGRLTPQSRCSSSSSVANSSKLDESFEVSDLQAINRSRASSIESHKDSSFNDASDRPVSPSSPLAGEKVVSGSSNSRSSPDVFNEGENLSATSFTEQDKESYVSMNKSSATEINRLKLDEIDSDLVFMVGNNVNSTSRESLDHSPVAVLHENDLSNTSSSHEDLDDIYAERYLRSRSETGVLSNHTSSVSNSPGYGNSLLCGLGWSSEVDGESLPSRPVVHTQPPLNDGNHSNFSDETDLVIREGMLQKKSFGLWRARWFVLTTSALAFYKDQSRKEELDVIRLVDVETVDDSNVKKKKVLRVAA